MFCAKKFRLLVGTRLIRIQAGYRFTNHLWQLFGLSSRLGCRVYGSKPWCVFALLYFVSFSSGEAFQKVKTFRSSTRLVQIIIDESVEHASHTRFSMILSPLFDTEFCIESGRVSESHFVGPLCRECFYCSNVTLIGFCICVILSFLFQFQKCLRSCLLVFQFSLSFLLEFDFTQRRHMH